MGDGYFQANRVWQHHGRFLAGKRVFLVLPVLWFLLLAGGCKRDDPEPSAAFPDDVAKLMRKTCATTGCHTSQSAAAAAGLNLESWEELFKGSRGGSPVVPYAPELSYLLYSVNTDTSLGPVLVPTMPFNQPTITDREYALLWQWIDEGARNALGEERFPPDPNRRKWYVGHGQCDEVAVFDAESRQVMRYVTVGHDPANVENAFDIEVSPDGRDWFVVFSTTSGHIERYSTLTDEKVAEIQLGHFGWNAIIFSPDSRFAFVSGDYWQELAVVDLQQNAMIGAPMQFPQEIFSPAIHPVRPQIYLSQHLKSALYVLDYDNAGNLNNLRTVDLVQGSPPGVSGELWPHEIAFLPDGSRYFVSCWNNREVRVLDGQTDSLLAVIPTPGSAGKMAYSASTGRLFVSCMDDAGSWSGAANRLGSIVVIDAQTYQIEETLYSGFQPYGLSLDEAAGVLLVANRNTDVSGPAPHHESTCGDRNGYLTLVDIRNLRLVSSYKPELLADPITVTKK